MPDEANHDLPQPRWTRRLSAIIAGVWTLIRGCFPCFFKEPGITEPQNHGLHKPDDITKVAHCGHGEEVDIREKPCTSAGLLKRDDITKVARSGHGEEVDILEKPYTLAGLFKPDDITKVARSGHEEEVDILEKPCTSAGLFKPDDITNVARSGHGEEVNIREKPCTSAGLLKPDDITKTSQVVARSGHAEEIDVPEKKSASGVATREKNRPGSLIEESGLSLLEDGKNHRLETEVCTGYCGSSESKVSEMSHVDRTSHFDLKIQTYLAGGKDSDSNAQLLKNCKNSSIESKSSVLYNVMTTSSNSCENTAVSETETLCTKKFSDITGEKPCEEIASRSAKNYLTNSSGNSMINSLENMNVIPSDSSISVDTSVKTNGISSELTTTASRTSIAAEPIEEDSDEDTIVASKASSRADLSLDQCQSLGQLGDLLRKAFAEDLKRAEGFESTLKRRATEKLLTENASQRPESDCPPRVRRAWTRSSLLSVPQQGSPAFPVPQRPGQLIMGVRREAHFYSHAYSDGVSETESEEDEDDHSTPTAPSSSSSRGSDFISNFSSSYGGVCASSSFTSSGVGFQSSILRSGSASPRKGASFDHACRSRPSLAPRDVLSLDSSRGRLTRDPNVTASKDSASAKDLYTPSASAKDPYTPSGSTKDPYTPSGSTKDPYTPSGSSKDLYTSSASSKDPYTPSGSTKDPYTPSGSTKDPYTPSGSTKDLYTVSIRDASSTRNRSSSRDSHRHSYACRDSHSRDSSEEPPPLASSTTCPEFTPSLRLSDIRHQQELRQQQQQQQRQQQQQQQLEDQLEDQLKAQQRQHQPERAFDSQRTPGRSGGDQGDTPSSSAKSSEDGDGKAKDSEETKKDDVEGVLSPGDAEESQVNGVQTKSKAYRIALELLHTEESYVRILHLIDQEFQFRVDQENRARPMFPAEHLPVMFSNVKSIYKLHHDFLLPQLRDRLAAWEECPRIGDIMTTLAPFLKMYTEYVRNFDRAIDLINSCQAKCAKFAAIMADIHRLESCGGLTLQHHMLCPVQRIPRYELLLRDYLRKLPTNHPDRPDTAKALHLVATAASHANDAIRKIDEFETLLSLQERISGCVDLVSPTRTLIKQGKVGKISARSGDHQERYLYLLSDLLLLCSPRLGGRVIHGPPHRLRARYSVNNLQVVEGDNLETANTFYIRDTDKTVELYTQTLEEKESWLAALFLAIEDTYRRRSSLRRGEESGGGGESKGGVLGVEAPVLLPVEGVNSCMSCGASFSMVRRKHHCRACGNVLCGKCCSHKASLPCEGGRTVKVCRDCHPQLQGLCPPAGDSARDSGSSGGSSRLSSIEGPELVYRTRGVLEVSAGAQGAVLKGPLLLRTTPRKGWQERFFALHSDFVLYSFSSSDDTTAVTATPLPGYTVTQLAGSRGEGVSEKERDRAFKLHYSKKQYFFLAPSKEDCYKWVTALQRAARAEAPEPT